MKYVLMEREYEYNDEGYSCSGESDDIGRPVQVFDTEEEASLGIAEAKLDLVRNGLPYEALNIYKDYCSNEWKISDLVELLGPEYVIVERKERPLYATIDGRYQKTGEMEPYEVLKEIKPCPTVDLKTVRKLFNLLNYRPYFIRETLR